jgi:hypothetical protein
MTKFTTKTANPHEKEFKNSSVIVKLEIENILLMRLLKMNLGYFFFRLLLCGSVSWTLCCPSVNYFQIKFIYSLKSSLLTKCRWYYQTINWNSASNKFSFEITKLMEFWSLIIEWHCSLHKKRYFSLKC